MKRGRLKRGTIKHMYDQDGTPSGHTVTAQHDPDMEGKNGSADGMGPGSYMPSPPDIETPHETYDSAESKAREHYTENAKRFGGGKKSAAMDESPMRAAMGRKK